MSRRDLLLLRSSVLPARSAIVGATSTLGLVAIAAINGFVASGLEGNLCFVATT